MTLNPNQLPDTFWHVQMWSGPSYQMGDVEGERVVSWLAAYLRHDGQAQFVRAVDVLGCALVLNAECIAGIWRSSPAAREHEAAWNAHVKAMSAATLPAEDRWK